MSRTMPMLYFAGDVVPHDAEAEFQLGIRGKSKVYKLTKQHIYSIDLVDSDVILPKLRFDPTWAGSVGQPAYVKKYFEVLFRGGGIADTAPFQRLLSMTDEEKSILLATTVRMFGSSENATMNVLNLTGFREFAESGLIIEMHESLVMQVTPEMLAPLAHIRLWADDVLINNADAVEHVLSLVEYLDAVKIGTKDLAIAFNLPIVKNPIDDPDAMQSFPHSQDLQNKILEFVVMANLRNPKLKFILELDVPLNKFIDNGISPDRLFIQGGPDGARVYVDPQPVERVWLAAKCIVVVVVVAVAAALSGTKWFSGA